jgi:hypothetical protein
VLLEQARLDVAVTFVLLQDSAKPTGVFKHL